MDAGADPNNKAAFLSSDRLASLSDTIFGVAMTLLATSLLPAVETLQGSVFDILRAVKGEMVAVVLGFSISANYWVVQQRRLAMAPAATGRQTLLHLVFLFLIVLLPISTGLWARASASQPVVLIYGAHFTSIGLVNLLLWLDLHRSVAAHMQILRSSLTLGLFAASVAVGAVSPPLAQYLWFAVLATPLISRRLARRLLGKGAPPPAPISDAD